MNKSTPWMAVLVVLVFGLGWTAHGVTDRVGPPAWGGKDHGDRAEHGERGERGPWGMGGRSFGGRGWTTDPFLRSLDGFATELGISDEQRARMDEIWASLTQEVKGLEMDIWALHGKAREDIHGLLDETQKQTYDQLIRDSFTRMKEAKMTRLEQWVRANTALDEKDVAAVMAIYRASEEEKGRRISFRGPPSRHHEPDGDQEPGGEEGRRRDEPREGSRDSYRDRDEKLLQYLSQQQIEELRNEARSMWGGRKP